MSFVRNLISRFLPGSASGEFKVAEDASARLLHLLTGPVRLYAFDFKAIPLKPEIQPMLGFLAAASDVFAHDAGGRLGGPGSINATLRVYQSLFDDRQTEALMGSTFELYHEPTEGFETGRKLGIAFATSLLRQDTDTPTMIVLRLFSERYRKYCGNPDGLDK